MKTVDLQLIKKMRKQHKYSQSEIAELIGLNVYQYHRKETGKQPLTAIELQCIADILGEDIKIFFTTDLQNLQIQ